MEISTASLLDEATAAAEAMTLLHRAQSRRIDNLVGPAQFFVADSCYPQTIDVLMARAEPLGIELVVGDMQTVEFGDRVFGALVQSPDEAGVVHDLRGFIARASASGVLVAVASDLLSLTLLTPPGEMGADVVLGNSQRFGVPMGYGGPHAAFFATKERHIRQSPGRIIGVSVDAHGHTAYRMSLQTREQHIRREKATSNICTAQALLANIAGLYAVYHGPKGLTAIAERVHSLAVVARPAAHRARADAGEPHFFDTMRVEGADVTAVRLAAESGGINLRYRADGSINIALDEVADADDVARIVEAFQVAVGKSVAGGALALDASYPPALARTTPFLTHPVFNTHHSEMEMMRYVRGLERKDIGLDTSMIPLGSCTMKLNAASEMLPITWPEFSKPHPFVPVEQVAGYQQIFAELENALSTDHRLRRGLAAAELRRAGRVRRADGHSRLSSRSRRRSSRCRAHPGIGARHQPGQRRHGRHARGGGQQHQGRQHRRRRPKGQGGPAQGSAVVPDGHLPVDARRVRGEHPGHLRHHSRARWSGVHGRRQHERAGRTHEPGGDWC